MLSDEQEEWEGVLGWDCKRRLQAGIAPASKGGGRQRTYDALKYILQLGEIQFGMWTNTSRQLEI